MWFDYINGKLMPGEMYTGGAGAGTGIGWTDEVQYYADLPAASGVSGQVYLVTTETAGDWWTAFLNKKPAGLYQSNGTAWIRLPNNLYLYSLGDTNITSANIASLKILAYNATSHVWEPKKLSELVESPVTDTYAATYNFDYNAGTNRIMTLTGNLVFTVSNFPTGGRMYFRFIQDGTGSRLITTFPSGITWPSNIPLVLTTTASKADKMALDCTAANAYDGVIIGQNL